MELHFKQAVPPGIVTMGEAFFSSMRLQEILDEMLLYDEEKCELTPGQQLGALMFCVFRGARCALSGRGVLPGARP